MDINVYGSDQWKAALEQFKQRLGLKYINPQETAIQPAVLRVGQVLSPNKQRYVFDFRETKKSDRGDNITLNLNDLFLGIFHRVVVVRQDADGNTGNGQPFPYADPNYFVGASGGVTEAECLETLFNGKLSFETDQVIRLNEFPIDQLRTIPEKQTFIGGGALTDQVATELPQYGPSPEARGWSPLLVRPFLDGGQNNNATIVLAEGERSLIAGGVSPANTSNVVFYELYGILAPNAVSPR